MQGWMMLAMPSFHRLVRVGALLGLLGAGCVSTLSRAVLAQQPAPAGVTGEPAGQELPKRLVLRFLTESDYPPFDFYDDEGVLTGFNVDLARAICLEVGATCDIKVAPWDELIPSLKRGDADAIAAGHVMTPKLAAEVDFSDRYFFMPGRFAGKRDLKIANATPEGLENRRIAVAKGSPHEAYIKTFFSTYSGVQVFENQDRAREALLDGKVDLVFDDGVGLAFWLNGTNSKTCCEFKGGPFLEPRFFGDGMAMAISKKDPQTRKLINTALRRVRESGRLEELVQRYFPYRIY